MKERRKRNFHGQSFSLSVCLSLCLSLDWSWTQSFGHRDSSKVKPDHCSHSGSHPPCTQTLQGQMAGEVTGCGQRCGQPRTHPGEMGPHMRGDSKLHTCLLSISLRKHKFKVKLLRISRWCLQSMKPSVGPPSEHGALEAGPASNTNNYVQLWTVFQDSNVFLHVLRNKMNQKMKYSSLK